MNKKINPKSIVAEEVTSYFIFAIPILVFVLSIIYVLSNFSNNLLVLFFVHLLLFVPAFLGFYKKKIIITKNSIYVYTRNKKILAWSLVNDLYLVETEQDKFGKFFGYGSLTLVNKNKEMYQYHFLNNSEEFKETIIRRYEKLMCKLDPTFVPTLKEKQKENIDTLKENNEK